MLKGEVGARTLRVKSQSVGGWSENRGNCNPFGSWVYAWVSVAFEGRFGVFSILFRGAGPARGGKVQGTADSE